jgi:hypothetical protein
LPERRDEANRRRSEQLEGRAGPSPGHKSRVTTHKMTSCTVQDCMSTMVVATMIASLGRHCALSNAQTSLHRMARAYWHSVAMSPFRFNACSGYDGVCGCPSSTRHAFQPAMHASTAELQVAGVLQECVGTGAGHTDAANGAGPANLGAPDGHGDAPVPPATTSTAALVTAAQ